MEIVCSGCGAVMGRVRRGTAGFWRCDSCGGHALTVSTLRKVVPHEVWFAVWPKVRAASVPSRLRCPDCGGAMEQTVPLDATGGMRFEICDRCRLLYLDPDEFEKLAKVPIEIEEQLPPEIRQAIARAEVERINQEYDEREEGLFPYKEHAQTFFALAIHGLLRSV